MEGENKTLTESEVHSLIVALIDSLVKQVENKIEPEVHS